MKRFLIVILSTLMITTAVGCSSKDTSTKGQNEITSEDKSSQENKIDNRYFGKIKKVVGNEIELSIAKEQSLGGIDENGDGELSLSVDASVEGGPVEDLSGSISVSATEAVESEKAPEGAGEQLKQEIIDDNKNKMELEYTGENKSLTIPAGATVVDFSKGGKEVKISDIKDGSVIRVYTAVKGDKEVVVNIEIVE